MDKVKVYLLVGFFGSGKSTWAKKKAEEEPNTIIVNKDSLRTMFMGSYGYRSDVELLVRECAHKLVDAAIMEGFDVIIDETSLTRKHRSYWLHVLKQFRNVELSVVHFAESEYNVAYRTEDDLRGLSAEEWAEILIEMRAKFEPVEKQEFPPGTKCSVVEMGPSKF